MDLPSLGGQPNQRFSEPVKFLPVAFVSGLIFSLYYIYMVHHAYPRYVNEHHFGRATVELIVFNVVTCLLVICYAWCILVHPGTIPEKDEDATWEYVQQDQRELMMPDAAAVNPQEWKKSGDRRQCKWCAKYKPDRCHHCRICRTCILKMDHHCPWIYNCVGFQNHKYFFLLLLYCSIDCNIIVWTMMPSVRGGMDLSTPFMSMFLLLFGETLASFLGVLVTTFFGFHIYLMLKAMTTIEFCEKSLRRSGYDTNVYDRGPLGNVKAVLGENVFLWFLPCSPPPGRGVTYVTEDMRLNRDMEGGRQIRRRAHQLSDDYTAEPKRRSSRPEASGGTGSAPGSTIQSEDEDTSSQQLSPHFDGPLDFPPAPARAGDRAAPRLPALSPAGATDGSTPTAQETTGGLRGSSAAGSGEAGAMLRP